MKQFFQDMKNSFLLSAIISIILGIVLIVYPVKTSVLICYIAGALLLFGGVVALIRYLSTRGEPFFFRYDLFVSLVLLLFGLFVILESGLVIAFLPIVIGLVLVINGIVSLQKAFRMKSAGLARWWVELLLALLTAILGILIGLNPFGTVAATNIFIGVCLIYSGISDLITTYYMGKTRRQLERDLSDRQSQEEILNDDTVIDVEEDELH